MKREQPKQIISYSDAHKLSQTTGMKPEDALSVWEAARRHNENPTPETAIAFRQALDAVEADVHKMLIESFTEEAVRPRRNMSGVPVQSRTRSSGRFPTYALVGTGVLALLVIAVVAILFLLKPNDPLLIPTQAHIPTLAESSAQVAAAATLESTAQRPTLLPTWTPTFTQTPAQATETSFATLAETIPTTDSMSLLVGSDIFHECTSEDVTAARTGVTNNSDWEPHRCFTLLNGVEKVLVPSGCFNMGDDAGGFYYEDIHPVSGVPPGSQQCFDKPFWVDKYEVTQKQFVDLGGVAARENVFPGSNRPRENITWIEAGRYCARQGGRLPTEAEWEYTARGPNAGYYTWGNANDVATLKQNTVYNPDNIPTFETQPIGSRPGGISWVGALDLLGNVEEWTSTEYRPYPYDKNDGREQPTTDPNNNRSVRGGAYKDDANDPPRAADRSYLNVGNASRAVGFRCVQDMTESPPLPTDVPINSVPPPNAAGLAECNEEDFTRASNGVATNIDWSPCSRLFAGVEMVLVPKGCFEMGSEDVSNEEKPVYQQCFDAPFWIDRTEVTRAMYTSCVAAAPDKCTSTQDNAYSTRDSQPINYVNWFQAKAYCEWRGGRLPTEREWEYAARGPHNLKYPWGNDWDDGNKAVWSGNSGDRTADVGSKPEGASWVGGLDISGNVWEWLSTIYDQGSFPYPYRSDDGREDMSANATRVLRGGSFLPNAISDYLRAALRTGGNPTDVGSDIGFRCVKINK